MPEIAPPIGLTWEPHIPDFLGYLKFLGTIADAEWGTMLTVPPMFFFDGYQGWCCVVPCRVKIPGEFVRIYIDYDRLPPSLEFIRASFRGLLIQLLSGLGKIVLDEGEESIVIVHANGADV
jgi:hypothetical protein